MPIDPAFFAQFEADGFRYPSRGQTIEYRRKGEMVWSRAVVEFVWMGIEPMVKLAGGPDVCPSIGDEWRPVGAGTDGGT